MNRGYLFGNVLRHLAQVMFNDFFQEERAMKKVWSVLMVFALIAGIGVSSASAKAYVSGNLGAVVVHDVDINDGFDTGEITFDTGLALTGAIGGFLGNGVRGEVELGYRANDIDEVTIDGLGTASLNGDVNSLSLMGNIFYDFAADESFSPFIMGGIGFSNVEVDVEFAGSEDDTVFAYQFGLGGSFKVSPQVNLDLQYRFLGTSDPNFGGEDFEYHTSNFLVGLRCNF